MASKSAKRATRAKPRTAAGLKSALPSAAESAAGVTGSIRSLAGQMMDIAGAAMDASFGVRGLLARDAKERRELARTGSFLRTVREKAGLTLADVGQAVDLKNVELLELAESGKAALPFEMILRLAAVYARNDPVPFVLKLTDTYSPAIGRTLAALGIGRLVEHARREHDFITIYRARDAARGLSDVEFERVLAFVAAAFDLALAFAAGARPAKRSRARESAPADE